MFSHKTNQSRTPDFAFVRRKDAHSGSSAGADSPIPAIDDTPTVMRKTMLSPPSPQEEQPTRVATATAVVRGRPWSVALAATLVDEAPHMLHAWEGMAPPLGILLHGEAPVESRLPLR